MPEPFQKGNSAEYVKEYVRIFRGGEKKLGCKPCSKCGKVEVEGFGDSSCPVLYCLACGEKLEAVDED